MTGIMGAAFGNSASADITPNALNWADISGALSASNAAQTIAGIDAGITLSVAFTGGATKTLARVLNGSSASIVNGGTVAVVATDQLYFTATNGGESTWTDTVTVKNVTDYNTILDTFGISVTGSAP